MKHDWKGGGDPVRYPYKTERSCGRCDLVKVTRHEPGEHAWIEWWKNGERVHSDTTPPCDGVKHDQRQSAAHV